MDTKNIQSYVDVTFGSWFMALLLEHENDGTIDNYINQNMDIADARKEMIKLSTKYKNKVHLWEALHGIEQSV